jgi:hypothetical protein
MNKRRFICKKNLFDLDLTYICDRVIAMAMPTVDGGATAYRNDIREVARFFATRHYGHFLVFNLCEEHEEGGNGNYDVGLLYEQVGTFLTTAASFGGSTVLLNPVLLSHEGPPPQCLPIHRPFRNMSAPCII